jgi:hypothetical protein
MSTQNQNDLNLLAQHILQMTQAATTDAHVADRDLRQVLRFIVNLVQVVDQAFQNVCLTLIDIELLKPEDLGTQTIKQIERDVKLVTTHSWYRESSEICSRLHHLAQFYNEQVEPVVNKLAQPQAWQEVFKLIDQYEGRIIGMVRNTLDEISRLLAALQQPQDVATIAQLANERRESISQVLEVLRNLQNQILGMSGRAGFIEMTATTATGRAQSQQSISIMIDQLNNINTAGGAYVGGNVNTGGDFVGRDRG